jgi:hypothetical protein
MASIVGITPNPPPIDILAVKQNHA